MTDHRFILSFCVLSALPPLSQPCLGADFNFSDPEGKEKKKQQPIGLQRTSSYLQGEKEMQ